MTGRLVVVSGTGTEIGKTHVAEAVLLALGAAGVRAAGVKPVESGVGVGTTDADRLARASSFHVKHSGVALRAPISPHLAARQEGLRIDLDALIASVESARAEADVVLVELPGGLFTPLTSQALNADLALRLRGDTVLLFAPDRLGVLHDAVATTRAATAGGLRLDGIVLIRPEHPDASTGTNALELPQFTPVPVVGTVPRAPASVLATDPVIAIIVAMIRRGPPAPDPA